MDDKTFKEYYEIERLKYCMGVVADWLNEHREYEIVEGEDRGTRVFVIQTKRSPLVAEVKKIFPFCCYEQNGVDGGRGGKMNGEENGMIFLIGKSKLAGDGGLAVHLHDNVYIDTECVVGCDGICEECPMGEVEDNDKTL